ncbi:MAG TPA: hypothetical protein VM287_16320, partial [Egibacteraceae bacterium]|nr:hypothetical protein [Egibacteraceae bacterium]
MAAVLLAVSVACGTQVPAGTSVPELRTQLSAVDGAVVAEDYAQAREALDALARTTADARDTGRLTPEQADRILAAVARLAADLPAAEPAPP